MLSVSVSFYCLLRSNLQQNSINDLLTFFQPKTVALSVLILWTLLIVLLLSMYMCF